MDKFNNNDWRIRVFWTFHKFILENLCVFQMNPFGFIFDSLSVKHWNSVVKTHFCWKVKIIELEQTFGFFISHDLRFFSFFLNCFFMVKVLMSHEKQFNFWRVFEKGKLLLWRWNLPSSSQRIENQEYNKDVNCKVNLDEQQSF